MARLKDLKDALVVQFPLTPVKSDPLRYLLKRIANVGPKVSLRKKQSRGRSALSRERTEILHLLVTPTEWPFFLAPTALTRHFRIWPDYEHYRSLLLQDLENASFFGAKSPNERLALGRCTSQSQFTTPGESRSLPFKFFVREPKSISSV